MYVHVWRGLTTWLFIEQNRGAGQKGMQETKWNVQGQREEKKKPNDTQHAQNAH